MELKECGSAEVRRERKSDLIDLYLRTSALPHSDSKRRLPDQSKRSVDVSEFIVNPHFRSIVRERIGVIEFWLADYLSHCIYVAPLAFHLNRSDPVRERSGSVE